MARRLVFTFLLLAVLPASPAAAVDSIRVGDASVRIAPPDGFQRLDGIDADHDARLQNMPPRTNRVAAEYGSEKDLEELQGGESPGFERTCSVQIPQSFEGVALSPADFQSYKDYLQKGLSGGIARYSPIIQALSSQPVTEVLGPAFSLEPGEIIPLGIDQDSDRSISFTVVTSNYWRKREGSSRATDISVSSASAMLVGDKLVLLYATSRYRDRADAEWTRATVAGWRDRIASMNAEARPDATEE